VKFLQELAGALVYMKSRGVIHRDIKCTNVLVASGPVLKLGDFGLSKVYAIGHSSRGSTMVGTPLYVAPEIAKGDYTGAVDIFSMGILPLRPNPHPLSTSNCHLNSSFALSNPTFTLC
jgi:serine/threonine protein kinase